MRDKGRAWIADHFAAITGQTVIPFPKPVKKAEGEPGDKPARG